MGLDRRMSSRSERGGRATVGPGGDTEEELCVHLGWKTRGAQSKEEAAALLKFKELLRRERVVLPPTMIYSADLDATLLRFLRARKLALDKSLKMIKDTLAWRKHDKVDEILTEVIPDWKLAVIRKHSRGAQLGFDKLGRPVYLDRPGFLEVDAILKAGVSTDDFLRKHVRDMEYVANELMWQASLKMGCTVDQTLTVIDATNITLSKLTKTVRDTFGRITDIDQNNYPETLGATIILNGGWVFNSVFKIVSTFLDPRTRAKVQVLGSSKKDLAVLQEFLDLNQIPEFIGGTLKESEVWDANGVSVEDRVLDKECKRRNSQRLRGNLPDAVAVAVANIPSVLHHMGRDHAKVEVCTRAEAEAKGTVVGRYSPACLRMLQDRFGLQRLDGSLVELVSGTNTPHTLSPQGSGVPASIASELEEMHKELEAAEVALEDMDEEVRRALESIPRILMKCREIKAHRAKLAGQMASP